MQREPDLVWRLLAQLVLRPASRAAWTAGSSKAIKMPMIAITTKSSTSVKPRATLGLDIVCTPQN